MFITTLSTILIHFLSHLNTTLVLEQGGSKYEAGLLDQKPDDRLNKNLMT